MPGEMAGIFEKHVFDLIMGVLYGEALNMTTASIIKEEGFGMKQEVSCLILMVFSSDARPFENWHTHSGSAPTIAANWEQQAKDGCSLELSGADNAVDGVHAEANNTVLGVQAGADNDVEGVQAGDDNAVEGVQAGAGNVVEGVQSGADNVVEEVQSGSEMLLRECSLELIMLLRKCSLELKMLLRECRLENCNDVEGIAIYGHFGLYSEVQDDTECTNENPCIHQDPKHEKL
ncbi:hypothetical protein QQ045_024290 [Rhodiola kirilowii]